MFLTVVAVAVALALPMARGQAPPPRDELDVTSYEVVYRVPGMDNVSVASGIAFEELPGGPLRLDLYRPPKTAPGTRLPAVVFVNGVGIPALKDWPIYRSWARLVAASGFAAVTFESRRAQVTEDIRSLFDYLRSHAAELGIDTGHVGVWSCSGNVEPALAYVASEAGAWLAAVVVYYGSVAETGPAVLRGDQPFFVVRAGRDDPDLNRRLAALVSRAVAMNAPWSVINATRLTHAFDGLDDGPESRQVVRDTVAFLERRLRPEPARQGPVSPAHAALNHVFGHELPEAVEAYGELIRLKPDDAGLHSRLGGLQLQLRHFPEAAASYRRAVSLGERGGATFYNLACALALGRDKKEALDALERAVGAGFTDLDHIASDADLAGLRGEPRFEAIVGKPRP